MAALIGAQESELAVEQSADGAALGLEGAVEAVLVAAGALMGGVVPVVAELAVRRAAFLVNLQVEVHGREVGLALLALRGQRTGAHCTSVVAGSPTSDQTVGHIGLAVAAVDTEDAGEVQILDVVAWTVLDALVLSGVFEVVGGRGCMMLTR